jgi:hypothetical protein
VLEYLLEAYTDIIIIIIIIIIISSIILIRTCYKHYKKENYCIVSQVFPNYKYYISFAWYFKIFSGIFSQLIFSVRSFQLFLCCSINNAGKEEVVTNFMITSRISLQKNGGYPLKSLSGYMLLSGNECLSSRHLKSFLCLAKCGSIICLCSVERKWNRIRPKPWQPKHGDTMPSPSLRFFLNLYSGGWSPIGSTRHCGH